MKNLHRELGITTQRGFYNIAKGLLDSFTVEDVVMKLDILNTPSYIRNSLHSNGIHYGSNKSIEINGVTYEFLNGEMVKCGSWSHIINVLNAVETIIEEIISSSEIETIGEPIKDEYIWQRES